MRLLYRADGGHPIGTGHIWRAVRLLRALAAQGPLDARLMFAEDPFAARAAAQAPARPIVLPPRADPRAVKPLLRAAPVLEELAREPADLVVVDMLDTPAADMEALAATGVPLATMDDRGPGRRAAGLLVNILVEEPDTASLRPETRLLQGPAYVTLDPVFARAHDARYAAPRREFGPLQSVFVAMGGADAAGLTVKVALALRLVEDLGRVELVCGPAFPHRAELEAAVVGAPWRHEALTGLPNLLGPYRRCDLAVVAGGLTMYECCCVGAPALAVCQPIDHQLELADRLAFEGAMATVGWGMDASVEQIADAVRALAVPEARRRLAERGPRLVDGRGTERVARALAELAGRGERNG